MRGATLEECKGRTAELGEELIGGDGSCQFGSDVDVLCAFYRRPTPESLLVPVFLQPGAKVTIVNGHGFFNRQFKEGDIFEAVPDNGIAEYSAWFRDLPVPYSTIKMRGSDGEEISLSDFKGMTVKVVEVPPVKQETVKPNKSETIFSRIVRRIKTLMKSK